MTIVDIKNAVFSHFLTETTFSLSDDIGGLGLSDKVLGECLAPHRDALVRAALNDFTLQGVTLEISPGVWILTNPIGNLSQNVVLSPMAAEMVADLVADWHDNVDGPQYSPNKLAITSYDIECLCHYCHFLLDEDTPLDGEEPSRED